MSKDSHSEAERVAAARRYAVVERGLGPSLSDACRLAALVCHRPMAAVEFVLDDEVVMAAAAGLNVGRILRSEALAPEFLGERRVVVIPDARHDARFRHRRLVATPRGVRLYAAVPLVSPEGHALGVLSVWDHEPGDLTPSQQESIEALGRMVMAQLDLGRRQRELEELEGQHARVEAAMREAEAKYRGIVENTVLGIYQTTPDGRYLSANPGLAGIYGYQSPEELMAGVGDIEHQLYVDPTARDRFVNALQTEDRITHFEAQIRRKDGEVIWIAETARVARDESGKVLFYEGTVQDITARKLAEGLLRNSEMLYHSLVEELPQNIFRKDTKERFIFANSRFCKTVEREQDEILGRTDFDLFPEELARNYQADDQRVMSEGKTLRKTERNVTPDGAVHWVEVVKTPLQDVTGAVVGIQGIFWDVTETKRLQDELAYQRDLLQALLDHSPDIIFFKDPQSRFVKVGRTLARRFGATDPQELVGKTLFDLLAPKVAETLHQEEQDLLRTGQPIVNKVEELIDHQGRRSWASVTKVPIYNRSGEILGLVGVSRDISQLIETEQALRDAEEKFRTIFENSVEGIFQTSLEGRFIGVNPALARIYGYGSAEELVAARTDVRTQVYVQEGRRDEFVKAVLERGSITGFEAEVYRRDGTTTWVSESARVVRDREGKPAYFEGTVEDISARKQIDAEREKARQAALESARLKSEFVATVSHEIRTPLNAIVPNTERLLETRLDSHQRQWLENVDHGARMLLQIVNDILDFSKIEAGAVHLESIDFDLHDLVERTIAFFSSNADTKRIELIGDIRSGVPREVRGDPARLGQIFNNLLGNAIKFTEAGEVVLEVEVDASRTTATALPLRIRVRDTGIGIAPEARSRVFQAFAQADGSMSRRYGGTGLGLAITREFVGLMGGKIDFESEVGRGTTFSFEVVLAPAAKPHPEAPAPSILAGRRVLVVDDCATLAGVIAACLPPLGAVSVVSVTDLASALEAVRGAAAGGAPIDTVFFDGNLAEAGAAQVTARIRAAGSPSAEFFALAPSGGLENGLNLKAAGIRGVLAKPVRQSKLASELVAILCGQPHVAPLPSLRPSGEPPAGAGLRVLLVEDNEMNQRVARELLQRLGATVESVDSGANALDVFRKRRFQLVLMDCQMPEMDGYEATRRLREVEANSVAPGIQPPRVPIVALSANALEGDRDRGLAAGMDDYLTKPLRQPELVRVLRLAASREAYGGQDLCPLPPRPASSPNSPVAAASPLPPDAAGAADAAPTEAAEAVGDIVDTAPLEALASPDDPSTLAGFVAQFIEEAPRRIDRIEAAARAGDAVVLRAESHSLKGNSSYMGARLLVKACADVEALAKSGEMAGAVESAARIRVEFGKARVALEAYIRRTGVAR